MTADPLERVEVEIAGRPFTGFSMVSIDYSVEIVARTAQLTVSDLAGLEKLLPGDPVVIAAGGDTLLTGDLMGVAPVHDERRHHVELTVKSRARDAEDCSIVHPRGQLRDADLAAIAREFDSCGVGIICDERFPKERMAVVRQGESLIEHLRPLARSHGALLYDTPEAKLRIATKPQGRHAGGLVIGPGGNIVAGSAHLSAERRHSDIFVHGQSARGQGRAAREAEGHAKDGSVPRYRPRIVVLEGEANEAKLRQRAERVIRRAAGFSRTADITTAGWRDAGGRIWTEHYIVAVSDPRLYVEQDMCIKSVRLTQSILAGGPGTRAQLSLADPAAFGGEAGGGTAQFETPSAKGRVRL